MDRRKANVKWLVGTVGADGDSMSVSTTHAQLAVLMDIRDELQRLNSLLHCGNFVNIPNVLKRISANTAKPRKRKRGS